MGGREWGMSTIVSSRCVSAESRPGTSRFKVRMNKKQQSQRLSSSSDRRHVEVHRCLTEGGPTLCLHPTQLEVSVPVIVTITSNKYVKLYSVFSRLEYFEIFKFLQRISEREALRCPGRLDERRATGFTLVWTQLSSAFIVISLHTGHADAPTVSLSGCNTRNTDKKHKTNNVKLT